MIGKMSNLGPDKAYIFRITHIENVPWILEHGLHCRNANVCDPNYRDIGNPDLITKRAQRGVPISPGGTLSDYIPFYFTPHSPMLLNIKTGYGGMKQTPMAEIVILVSSLRAVAAHGGAFVFTDRHAYLWTAEFFNDLGDLERVDWALIQRRDFARDPDDPGKMERYQAEALVHRHLPVKALAGLACQSQLQEQRLAAEVEKTGHPLKIVVKPDWYF
jgi:hypothetical protein